MIRLGTINRVLRCFGLVLVVSYDPAGEECTWLWLERVRNYDART